jgi:tetratricopeptide (TPR) repeat protein
MLKSIFSSSGQRKTFWLLALIIAIGYAQVVTFNFVNWDDNTNISANPEIIFPGLMSYWYYWSSAYGGLFTPIPFTVWTFVAQITQFIFAEPQPVSAFYHVLNVLVHIANTGLVFALLLYFLESPDKTMKKKELPEFENRRRWAAGLGAAIFALHPIQVESVAWATGFKDLIFGFFALWTLHLVLRDRMRAASVTYVAALLSKPTAVILPFLAIGLLFMGAQKVTRRRLYIFGAWLFVAIADIFITRDAQSAAPYTFVPNFWQRIVVAFDALAFYLGKVLFPYPLATDYGRNPKFVIFQDAPNWTWLLLLAFIVLAFLPWARRLRMPQGAAFAVMTVLPVLGFVSFSYQISCTVADRYMYLGLAGLCIPVARAFQAFPQRFVKPGLMALIGVYGLMTMVQARTWQDSETLFTNVIAHSPPSLIGRTQLGAYYSSQGKYDLAEPIYVEQIQMRPDDVLAYIGLARSYQKTGRPLDALKTLEKSLEVKEDFADTHTQIADLLVDLGRIAEAETHLARALKIDPNCYEAFYLEGNILAKQEKYQLASQKYLEAIKYLPNHADAHNNLGNTLAILKDISGAQLHFRIAAKLSPSSLPAHLNFARTLLMTGGFGEAYQQLQYVLHLDPNHAEARQLLDQLRSRVPGFR